jgi:hypothetical protein
MTIIESYGGAWVTLHDVGSRLYEGNCK